ncbi:conserved hypothetical protein [Cronobacter turicensis 564]|nr:conserved hypothetical protein [Cronobacter turicensis 564]
MEIAETATTGKQIAHMHVDSLKARAVERCRHLDMRVNALLAQHRDFRTRAGGDKRRGDILFDIERQFHVEARIAVIGFRLMFLIRARRIIAQALHLPGGFRPPHAKLGAAFAVHHVIARRQGEAIACDCLAKIMRAFAKTVIFQHALHLLALGGGNLNHRAQLFVKQRRQRVVAEGGDIRLDAAVTGKGHLRQRHQQAAVGTVVVGQQFTLRHQRLDGVVEAFQLTGVAHVGRLVAKLTIDLRQRRRAQRVMTIAEIDKQQRVIFGGEFRRHGAAHIFHTGESGDHQRHRRGHLALFAILLPAGFHRH